MTDTIVAAPADAPYFLLAEKGSGQIKYACTVAFRVAGAAEPEPILYPQPGKTDLIAKYERSGGLFELPDGRFVDQIRLSEIARGES